MGITRPYSLWPNKHLVHIITKFLSSVIHGSRKNLHYIMELINITSEINDLLTQKVLIISSTNIEVFLKSGVSQCMHGSYIANNYMDTVKL